MSRLSLERPSLPTPRTIRDCLTSAESTLQTARSHLHTIQAPKHKSSIGTLTKLHYFTRFKGNKNSLVTIKVNNTLSDLIYSHKSGTKKMLINSIFQVQNVSSSPDQLNFIQGKSHKKYFFLIKSQGKILKLGTNTQYQRENWINALNLLLKISLEQKSQNGLRKYWQGLQDRWRLTAEVHSFQKLKRKAQEENGLDGKLGSSYQEVIAEKVNWMIQKIENTQLKKRLKDREKTIEQLVHQNRLLKSKIHQEKVNIIRKNEQLFKLTDDVAFLESKVKELSKTTSKSFTNYKF